MSEASITIEQVIKNNHLSLVIMVIGREGTFRRTPPETTP